MIRLLLSAILFARGAPALAAPPPDPAGVVEVHTREPLLGGEHLRIPTPRGAIHVFAPARYDRRSASLVLFAHGHGTTADRVFGRSRLAAQFAASLRNALFVIPDGPQREGEPVAWPSLGELLDTLAHRLCAELPRGPVTAVAHSSGLRTLIAWIRDARVREVVLLDGLYGHRAALAAWLGENPRRRLLLVAARSRSAAEGWVRGIPRARRIAYVPRVPGELTAEERAAPLLYLRSQYAHSERRGLRSDAGCGSSAVSGVPVEGGAMSRTGGLVGSSPATAVTETRPASACTRKSYAFISASGPSLP